MLRKLLTVVLPIALPFIVYGIYVFLARRRAQAAGEAGTARGWQDAPWAWIATASAVLLAATLIAVRVMSGVPPGTQVEPPRLIDGEIQPARPVE